MTDVRTLLHDLADEAPAAHGADTADRAVDAHRRQDRRRLRWAGVAAAAALVVAVTPAVLDRTGPSDAAATAVGTADLGLYDLPTRGSLAGDGDLVAQALAASWDDGIPREGLLSRDPAPGTRRVAFLGEVPGGQVWALVLGRTGSQTTSTWFVDTDVADGVDLQVVGAPALAFPDTPIALGDTRDGGRGALVVVTTPGDEVDYAPDGSGSPTDDVPVYRSLPVRDGVAVAEVDLDEDRAYPGYRVVRDDVVAYAQPPTLFDSSSPLGPHRVPTALVDPVYGPLIGDCLRSLGWPLTTSGSGAVDLGFLGGQRDTLSFLADVGTCGEQVGAP